MTWVEPLPTRASDITVTAVAADRVKLTRASGDQHEGELVLSTSATRALRAWFRAEHDSELGWQRDPQNPDMVWKTDARLSRYGGVRVFNQRTLTVRVWRETECRHSNLPEGCSARRYFATSAFWEDAAHGDVWLVRGSKHAGERLFVFWNLDSPCLSAVDGSGLAYLLPDDALKVHSAHRLWPTPDSAAGIE